MGYTSFFFLSLGGGMDILAKGYGGLGLWRKYVLDSGDV